MKAIRTVLQTLAAACCVLALTACGGDSRLEFIGGVPTPDSRVEGAFVATLGASPDISAAETGATGAATLDIRPNTREVVAVVTLNGITATSVTIRSPGLTRPVVLALAETPPASGVWTGSGALSADQFAALRAGELFIEAASLAFPEGELRGSLVPQERNVALSLVPQAGASLTANVRVPRMLMATLSGDAVVPAVSSQGRGAAAAIVDPVSRVMEVALAASGAVPDAVVVGAGAAGINGDEVLALAETAEFSGVWFGRTVLSEAQLDALLAGNLYLLARSAAYPEGELRGQLLPQRQAAGFAGNRAAPDNIPDPILPGAPITPFADLDTSFGAGSGRLDEGIGVIGIGFGSTGFGNSGFGSTGLGTTGFDTSGGTSGFTIPGSSTATTPGSIGIGSTPGSLGFDSSPGSIGTGTSPGSPAGIGLGTAPGSIGSDSQSGAFGTPLPGADLGSAIDPLPSANPLAPLNNSMNSGGFR